MIIGRTFRIKELVDEIERLRIEYRVYEESQNHRYDSMRTFARTLGRTQEQIVIRQQAERQKRV